MGSFLSQLFTGLSIGATLLLIALGLTFTFGQMNVINMAHGEFIMAGAYTAYLLQSTFGRETSLLVSLPVAFVVAGTLGVALETVLIRRMYGRPLDTLLVTWGVSLMLQQLARDLFGAANVQVLSPPWLVGGVHVAGVDMPYARLFIIALVAAAVAGIWVYLTYLPQGRRMRAVMQNRQLAACSGIPTARVDRRTFFIGSGLAGVAGVALTQLGSIGPTLGTNYLVDAFLVVVVGGLGQIRGAVIAAIALGVLDAYVEWGTSASFAQGVVFGLGGYAMGMYLKLQAAGPGKVPDFMSWSGVEKLPLLWRPFQYAWVALPAVIIAPMAVAAALGFMVFRRRVRGAYFAILTQALAAAFVILLVGEQGYTGGTNGLTNFNQAFGFDLADPTNQRTLYLVTAVILGGVF